MSFKHYKGKDRYQFQPWYIKLWRRCRFQWRVPIVAAEVWWKFHRKDGFKFAWSYAVGWSHCEMGYLYTLEEVKARLKEKDGEQDDT